MDDYEKQKMIYENVEKAGEEMERPIPEKSSIEEAIVEIREDVSLDDIVKEQNVQQITYAEIKAIADDMDWEYSLEELLAGID